MPDQDGNAKVDEETLPDSSLHAYKEGRKEDVSGDADALESNDPKQQQARVLEDEDEPSLEKH